MMKYMATSLCDHSVVLGKLIKKNSIFFNGSGVRLLSNELLIDSSFTMMRKSDRQITKVDIIITGKKIDIFNKYTTAGDIILVIGSQNELWRGEITVIVENFKLVSTQKEIIDDDYEEFTHSRFQHDFLDYYDN